MYPFFDRNGAFVRSVSLQNEPKNGDQIPGLTGWIGILTVSTTLYVRGMAIFVTTLVIPAFTLHDPALQVVEGEHLCPQVPQLDGSVRRLTQAPSQQVGVSDLHTFPHDPQFVELVERSTHVPPQFVLPRMTQFIVAGPTAAVVTTWRPETVVVVVVGEVLVIVVVTGAVVVEGMVVIVPVGTLVQTDELQIMPAGQTFPHAPQLSGLDASS
jgi:hypothetical protein